MKVKWSKENIERISQEIAQFIEGDIYEAIIEIENSTGRRFLKARTKEDIPENVFRLVGETAYHLRSSLDLMVNALVRASGGTPTSQTQFPFAGSLKDFQSSRTRSKIKELPPDLQDMIVALRPHKGGDDELWGLSKLSNIDRHRGLVSVGAVGAMTGMADLTIEGTDPEATWTGPLFGPRPSGRLNEGVLIFELGPHIRIGGAPKFHITGDVAFGDVEVFGEESVSVTLRRLAQKVDGIIKTFDQHLRARGVPFARP